jgi:hypothetical protein
MTKFYKSLTLAAVIVSIGNSAEASTVVRWFKEAIGGGGNPAGVLNVASPTPSGGPPTTTIKPGAIAMGLGKIAVRLSGGTGAGGADTDTASVTTTIDGVTDGPVVAVPSEASARKVGKPIVIYTPVEEITGGAGIGTQDGTSNRPGETDGFVAGYKNDAGIGPRTYGPVEQPANFSDHIANPNGEQPVVMPQYEGAPARGAGIGTQDGADSRPGETGGFVAGYRENSGIGPRTYGPSEGPAGTGSHDRARPSRLDVIPAERSANRRAGIGENTDKAGKADGAPDGYITTRNANPAINPVGAKLPPPSPPPR